LGKILFYYQNREEIRDSIEKAMWSKGAVVNRRGFENQLDGQRISNHCIDIALCGMDSRVSEICEMGQPDKDFSYRERNLFRR